MAPRKAEDCADMEQVRAEIDRIDATLVDLIGERFSYVDRAWQFKQSPAEARVPWRIQQVIDKVRERAAELKQPVIACLGLSYKKDVDDLRESPAVEIVRRLAEERVGELLVVEPHISKLPDELGELGLTLQDFDRAVGRVSGDEPVDHEAERAECGLEHVEHPTARGRDAGASEQRGRERDDVGGREGRGGGLIHP